MLYAFQYDLVEHWLTPPPIDEITGTLFMYLPAIILLILIQTIDKCKKCCCSQWCIINCLPITNFTVLDTDKMDELIEIQENKFQEEWNMVEVLHNNVIILSYDDQMNKIM